MNTRNQRFPTVHVRKGAERDLALKWANLSFDPKFRTDPKKYRHWAEWRFQGYYDYTLHGKINERGQLIIR